MTRLGAHGVVVWLAHRQSILTITSYMFKSAGGMTIHFMTDDCTERPRVRNQLKNIKYQNAVSWQLRLAVPSRLEANNIK